MNRWIVYRQNGDWCWLLALMLAGGWGTLSGRAELAGSVHDFSSESWSAGELCIVCHTPHNADLTEADSPLWNHELTTASFTGYSSSTLEATPGQPSGSTKLCLSCHDGTVALDSFGGSTGSTMIPGNASLGTDLSDDHPVSIVYDDTLAAQDGGLHPPSSTGSGLGRSIDPDLLKDHQLECSSCHDVHNGTGQAKLPAMSNLRRARSLPCHDM